MQNGLLSEYGFIFILGNTEEKKAELKWRICMQPLLQDLLGYEVVVVFFYIQRFNT